MSGNKSEPVDHDADVFPITEREAEALSKRGWNSGFGWRTDYDYWIDEDCPNDDPVLMYQFLSDLQAIRREHEEADREADRQARLIANAKETKAHRDELLTAAKVADDALKAAMIEVPRPAIRRKITRAQEILRAAIHRAQGGGDG